MIQPGDGGDGDRLQIRAEEIRRVSEEEVLALEFPREDDCSVRKLDAQPDQPTAGGSQRLAVHWPAIDDDLVENLGWNAESVKTRTMDGEHDEGCCLRSCCLHYLH